MLQRNMGAAVMMKLKLLIPSLAIMLSAMVAFAQEVTVSYQGNFVTESPRVALDSDSAYPDHYQGVINYNFEAEPENAVCAFYATKEEAAPKANGVSGIVGRGRDHVAGFIDGP